MSLSCYYNSRAYRSEWIACNWGKQGSQIRLIRLPSVRAWLGRQGSPVSRKRVQRPMRIMGLRAIYRQPRTCRPAPAHRVYPYLLRNAQITRPNTVWVADITYLPMARRFLYLVAIIDWHSRYLVAWGLSNTLGAGLCTEALTLRRWPRPEVFNTDQGSQFSSRDFPQILQNR